MKINFNKIPKFVINLERRSDRLDLVTKEFEYMGWEFERFNAVDTNSYLGCAYSHQQIAQIILDRGYEFAMVFEDDIFFMPYTKKMIPTIEEELSNTDWEFFHFAPAVNRPLLKWSDNFVDLTNLPPKEENHREIFGTGGFILTPSACKLIIKWNTNEIIENSHMQKPIDEFFALGVYPRIKSFSWKYPLLTQRAGFSDINRTLDNNHYLYIYQWNGYCPDKLDNQYLDFDYCLNLRKNEN